MTVSVVMPVYNGAKYLEVSVSSILQQTHSDFELITIDDGSVDSTPEILARFAKRDPRVKIIRTEKHGKAFARSLGITSASREFVVWQDADDISTPDRLERLLSAVQAKRVQYVYSDMLLVDSMCRPIGYWQARPPGGYDLLPYLLAHGTPINNATALVRRELLAAAEVADIDIGEDTDLVAQYALNAAGDYIPEPLLIYRRHAASATARTYQFSDVQRLIERHDILTLVPEARWPDVGRPTEEALAHAIASLKLRRRGARELGNKELHQALAMSHEVDRDVMETVHALDALGSHRVRRAQRHLAQGRGPAALLENYRGEISAYSGKRAEAIGHFLRAIELAPLYAEPYSNLKALGGKNRLSLGFDGRRFSRLPRTSGALRLAERLVPGR